MTLRQLEADDWPVVHTWGRLLDYCRFQPWGPDTEDESRAFVAEAAAAWTAAPQIRYAYLVSVDGQAAGTAELNIRNAAHRHGELSYGLHPRVWGKGIGTAVAQQLLEIGFNQLGLHRIMGTCDPRNVGSARVLAKAGMTYEGRMRQTLRIRDGWRDSELFSILEDEWRPASD
ncbi:GNAT family N-acetyltransferase [Mangrovactinospora gilvigrisea]|uniref:GNAT family N-acetyltransferase n=1 Tax=Mangrovactinospora gilvigrisea TaxID=1428644 RepID=UPI001FE44F5F|nr:GNAT family protein [Mangrovactinospora gilvigrisea]